MECPLWEGVAEGETLAAALVEYLFKKNVTTLRNRHLIQEGVLYVIYMSRCEETTFIKSQSNTPPFAVSHVMHYAEILSHS